MLIGLLNFGSEKLLFLVCFRPTGFENVYLSYKKVLRQHLVLSSDDVNEQLQHLHVTDQKIRIRGSA